MLSKCYTHYISKSGRPSSGHRTGKGRSLCQFPRRVVVKNVQIIRQLHSPPTLVRSCLKSCILGFNITRTKNFQTSKLGLEQRNQKSNFQHLLYHVESKGIPEKNIYLCFMDYAKAFHCVCAKSLQLCPTLCNSMDCSLPGSSVHGILQARILEWLAISFSRGFS